MLDTVSGLSEVELQDGILTAVSRLERLDDPEEILRLSSQTIRWVDELMAMTRQRRTRAVHDMVAIGWTVREVSIHLGLTKSRVHQLLKEVHPPPLPSAPDKPPTSDSGRPAIRAPRKGDTPAPAADDREYLSSPEAAYLLRTSVRTLKRWRLDGDGPEFIRVGRRVLYERTAVLAWLSSNTATREVSFMGSSQWR